MLQKRDAEKIAAKLGAETAAGGRHVWAKFRLDGRAYKFSIRHGRKSDHSHLTRDLRIPLRKLQDLAR